MNPEEKENKPPLEQVLKPVKSLRTYQGDVEEAISKNNYSSADIFLAEQQKKSSLVGISLIRQNPELKRKLYLTFGIILLVLGIGIVTTVYYIRSSEKTIVEQRTKALIGFSQEKVLSVTATTRERLINQLLDEKNSFSLPVNSILYINTANASGTPADIENVLALLSPKMPGSLSRSFSPKYMIGIFSFDTNEPFIILTTEDLALSFAGMLKWEKDMVSDVGKLFGIIVNASSTPSTFLDQERRNEDLRVLKGEDGKIILLYSFIDNDTLLITKNENIFSAILSRFLISQQEK